MRLLSERTLSALVPLIPFIPFTSATPSSSSNSTNACLHLTHLFNTTSATIRFTETIAEGSNFTGDSTETSYNTVQTNLPQACRAALETNTTSNSTARFEVWMPTQEAWNGRLLVVGNGGWAGGINYPDIVMGLKRGFASMSTDTGHNSTAEDATWSGNPEQMVDFGHRALHLTTVASKELLPYYYNIQSGNASFFSYYAGCSTGGRQGWNEVQRYPADFDGVLVGAPANWMTHLPAWDIRVALEQFPNNRSSYIPSSMWDTIHTAVLAQCDKIDGLEDGILMDPTKCLFHPEVLLCGRPGVNASACLNSDQVANLKRAYDPWWETNNTFIFPGLAPGTETGWDFLFNSATPEFGIDFFRNAVLNSSTWDYSTINASTVALADAINPGGINAVNPDLRPFQNKGHKVMEYHGYQDPTIPSLASAWWYNKVQAFYEDIDNVSDIEDFYRLFMVPGMQHCSDGDGAWVTGSASQSGIWPADNSTDYSLIWSLIDWVENGNAPEAMIGTKFVDDEPSAGVAFTRPYCRFPVVAEYQGSGNVSDAANWACPTAGIY